MSGIFGIFLPPGRVVDGDSLRCMAAPLAARGPDGTRTWHQDQTGLGHTLLATTPELRLERQPWYHPASGCVITADVRLDNRTDLLSQFGLRDRAATIGDAELIVRAWLAWGEACTDRLLGDFAFALFDPRQQRMMLARDHTGMRPLYYHHSPHGPLVFASEARAVLASGLVPRHLNEGRIADFLVGQLEGYDKVSTFFEEVHRLAPAHRLLVSPERTRLERYWRPEPQPELRLADDQAYVDAFLEVFTESVRCRLRSPDAVGSMLSGGMDSGSVVAVARRLLQESGQPPLKTFSAIGPNPDTCIETRTIGIAASMDGIEPHFVDCSRLEGLMPELEDSGWDLQEPFDNHMTLLRAVWIAAHRKGIRVVLHGAGGDIVFAHGSHPARMIRSGRWLQGLKESWGEARFHAAHWRVCMAVAADVRAALVPEALRRTWRSWRAGRAPAAALKHSLISPGFAHRIDLVARLLVLARQSTALSEPYLVERARALDHPYAVVGHERYGRVASAHAIEPRDPFMDRRVVEFCLGLPGEQRLAGGWPKILLRRAMSGRLPDTVRWRRGKQHLGWSFTRAFLQVLQTPLEERLQAGCRLLAPYVDAARLARISQVTHRGDDASITAMLDAAHLAAWLRQRGEPV